MRVKKSIFFPALLLAGFAVVVFALTLGAAEVSWEEALKIVGSRLPGYSPEIIDSTSDTIVWQIRFPRLLLALLIGASLSMAGASFQGLLQNPLADPYTIGVSSGSALGVVLAMTAFQYLGFSGRYLMPLAGFLGAMLTLFLVYRLAQVGGKLPVATLLLSGVILSSFFSAIISLIMFFAGEQMRGIFFWLAGGLGMRGWPYVWMVAPYFLIGLALLMYYARDLNLVLLGEETAFNLGVEVEKVKKRVLLAASLVTASAVSVSGMIGFVGLIVPHAARMIIGPDHRALLPASVLLGGVFMVVADTFARTALAPVELPVGIVTAFLGAPFFMYLLWQRRDTFRF